MGASLCGPGKSSKPGVGPASQSWAGNESENPFELHFTRKERVCLRETWQRLNEPKDLVGLIFVDIVADHAPELKKVFGVDRAPKASMLKMPKLGGHVARFTELIDQLTLLLGFTENILGAWQLIRKTGRMHTKQEFLETHQNSDEKNYFEIVARIFVIQIVPYLTGEQEEALQNGHEAKKVRFAQNYSTQMITDIWQRFFNILVQQLTESFDQERIKQSNAQNQKSLAPFQHVEEGVRKKKRIQERQSEMENTTISTTEQKQEELFEDPF